MTAAGGWPRSLRSHSPIPSVPARLALLAAAFAFAATTASQPAAPLPYAALRPSPTLDRYAGRYATDGGAIEVRGEGDHLVLLAHGAPVAGRLAALALPSALTDRAAALLHAWVTGNLAPLATATARPDRAAASFEAHRRALVRGHGPILGADIAGTFRQAEGPLVTLARLRFERGAEWASLVWHENGSLATVRRGLAPVVVGTVRPAGPDAFEGPGLTVTFHREADGRIAEVEVADRLTAMR